VRIGRVATAELTGIAISLHNDRDGIRRLKETLVV
jgi:hypothetical protein